jgi:hypothetical protein
MSLARRLGFAPQAIEQAAREFVKLYKFFVRVRWGCVLAPHRVWRTVCLPP